MVASFKTIKYQSTLWHNLSRDLSYDGVSFSICVAARKRRDEAFVPVALNQFSYVQLSRLSTPVEGHNIRCEGKTGC